MGGGQGIAMRFTGVSGGLFTGPTKGGGSLRRVNSQALVQSDLASISISLKETNL